MPDLESRLPEMLRRTATGRAPVPGLERRVLRRSRRRRVLNASAAGLAAIALVAGGVVGAQGLLRADRIMPGDESPTPTANVSPGTVVPMLPLPAAVWPEVDRLSLETAQAQADAGELGWRLDPVQTAAAFATQIMGWDAADVQARPLETTPGAGGYVIVPVSNAGLEPGVDSAGSPAPTTAIVLAQLGEQGEDGVWTVIGASSQHIQLEGPGGRLVDTIPEWTLGAWALVGGSRIDPSTPVKVDGQGRFSFSASGLHMPAELAGPGETIGVLLALWDPEGTLVTATAFPYEVPGSTGPSGGTGPTGASQALPSAVLATRDAIENAAEARDFDALEALIDPNRFSYNFSDGSNPVPEWRTDPAVLDTLATIMRMSVTTNREVYPNVEPSSPTVYIWPALMASDLEDPTPEDRAMLDALGITDRDVRSMIDAFGGYVGPRAGIAEDGTWTFFTIGGD